MKCNFFGIRGDQGYSGKLQDWVTYRRVEREPVDLEDIKLGNDK